jgi:hypothetical protein
VSGSDPTGPLRERDRRAAGIADLAARLGAPVHRLRSFKLQAGEVVTDRDLYGVRVRDAARVRAELVPLLRALACPAPFVDEVCARLPGCRFVHLGREGRRSGDSVRVYLERRAPPAAPGPTGPVEVHRAFKWAADGSGGAVDSYVTDPAWGAEEIRRRVTQLVGVVDARLAELVLERWRPPVPDNPGSGAGHPQLLEVVGVGHARHSIDLSLLAAGVRVSDLEDLLDRAAELAGVDRATVRSTRMGGERVARIAAGRHRSGEAFLTVYLADRRPG